MKRSNVNMSKPTTNKLNTALSAYTCNTKSKKAYIHTCSACGHKFVFHVSKIKDQIIKCPECGQTDVYFSCNYIGKEIPEEMLKELEQTLTEKEMI